MIYFPKIYGTCSGANNAINMAIKAKKDNPKKNVFIYKEILHNNYVVNELNKLGITIIDSLDNLTKNDIVIIRAHGEKKSTFDYLDSHNITYYDATCVNVKRIHDIVLEKKKDYKIIIVGKKEHPEVIATNGYANDEAIIIENKDDYKQLDNKTTYYLVSQTTIGIDAVNDLKQYMDKNKINYECSDTICNYQKLIQSSSVTLARDMDMMIVIGGKNSSNTKELFNECAKVCDTYFFSEIEEFYEFIKTRKFKPTLKIGFTGGASTMKDQVLEYSNLLEFYIYYTNRKKDIENEITTFNNKIKSEKNNKIITDALDKFIYMNFDGKCIRGTLIDLGYKTLKNDDNALSLSASYEAFETSILIHDDIIDNSPLRRGKKTIHELYKDEFKGMENDNSPTSLALCLGDIGFFYINKYIIEHYKDNKNLAKILTYYNDIVIDTAKGEILDVYLPYIEKNDKKHKLKEEDVMEIYKLKTSIYTIVGPFTLGMMLSNNNDNDIEEMRNVLLPLGIAFQIKDDIIGIFSSSDVIGKPNYSDIEEFKQTILYSYIKINKPEYLDRLLKIYGKHNISDKEYNEIKDILTESGSLEYANNKMIELFNESKEKLSKVNINENVKNILFGFIKYLELRKK